LDETAHRTWEKNEDLHPDKRKKKKIRGRQSGQGGGQAWLWVNPLLRAKELGTEGDRKEPESMFKNEGNKRAKRRGHHWYKGKKKKNQDLKTTVTGWGKKEKTGFSGKKPEGILGKKRPRKQKKDKRKRGEAPCGHLGIGTEGNRET